MANPTPPLLTSILKLSAGEYALLNAYQGIRFTIVPDPGAEFEYSFVDDDEASLPQPPVHDAATAIVVTALTTVDLTWPYILVSCNAGAGRVALV